MQRSTIILPQSSQYNPVGLFMEIWLVMCKLQSMIADALMGENIDTHPGSPPKEEDKTSS